MNKQIVRMLLRVSSNQQLSIDGDLPEQRSIVENYIQQQKDWVLDKYKPEYYEGGVSGFKNSVADREVLQEILRDAKNKEFQILVCYKDDRLGRREFEIPQYIKQLAEFGVLVFTVKDGCITPKNHTESLMNFVRYWHAEGTSIDTAQRVKDVKMEIAKQGKNIGGKAPYGYRYEYSGEISKNQIALKKKVIVPEQAEMVKKIFHMALYEGLSAYQIAIKLNQDERIKKLASNGKAWSLAKVRDILKNPIYTGYPAYNKHERKDGKIVPTPKEKWVYSEECLEDLRIISMDTWKLVQRQVEERKVQYKMRKAPEAGTLPLIDVLYCGYCGTKLTNGNHYAYWTRKNGEKRQNLFRYYRCPARTTAQTTKCKREYKANVIEEKVFAIIKNCLSDLEDNSNVLEEVTKEFQRMNNADTAKLKSLELAIAKEDKNKSTLEEELIKALQGESKLSIEVVNELLEKCKEKLSALHMELQKKKDEIQSRKNRKLDVQKFMKNIPTWKEVFETGSYAEQRVVVNKFVKRIEVKEGEICVEMKISLQKFYPEFLM